VRRSGQPIAVRRLAGDRLQHSDPQLWAPTLLGGDFVQWRNRLSGFCLEAPTNINLTQLIQDVCDVNNPGQQWKWGLADDIGHNVLMSKFDNKCMAFDSSRGIDGMPMVLFDCQTVVYEMFRIDK
jgi:hypothetical protein